MYKSPILPLADDLLHWINQVCHYEEFGVLTIYPVDFGGLVPPYSTTMLQLVGFSFTVISDKDK